MSKIEQALYRSRVSQRLKAAGRSAIREMMSLNSRLHGAAAVDLAAGIPELAPPPGIFQAACSAIEGGANQYAQTLGAEALRSSIARRVSSTWGHEIDPSSCVTVCCGTTEAFIAALLAVADAGDEVIFFEPAYDSYAASCRLFGITPRSVKLQPPAWRFDPEELRAAITPATRALVINSPHNPTGRVFSRSELEAVAALCIENGLVAITDEVYECFVYDAPPVAMATLPGMRERTIAISGASKMFAVTGWRIGWVVAEPSLSEAIRGAHDLLTVGAPHPLQLAVADAMESVGPSYYRGIREELRARRDLLTDGLGRLGFQVTAPQGGFFVMAGIAGFGFASDVTMARHLIERCAVSSVPGSGFYTSAAPQPGYLRFAFARSRETITRALDRLHF